MRGRKLIKTKKYIIGCLSIKNKVFYIDIPIELICLESTISNIGSPKVPRSQQKTWRRNGETIVGIFERSNKMKFFLTVYEEI